MAILFTITLAFLFTITLVILFTITLAIQFTISTTFTPIATGWSDLCRVGISPTEDSCLFTAH
jgi:hypothetical protein